MKEILPAEKNPVLRYVAMPVVPAEIGSARIQELIREMKSLLAKEKYGVALAAPQVGEPLQLFIVSGRALARDASPRKDKDDEESEITPLPDQVYINPELIKISRGKVGKHEGCLSIPGKWGTVPRAEKATVRAYDENGVRFTRGASGFLAHVFQHEMDHLAGILYIDKATEVHDDEDDDEE